MNFDKVMRAALRDATLAPGSSQSEIARRSGVSQKNISRYISGFVGRINDRLWRDLYPVVAQYIPASVRDHYAPDQFPQPPILKSDLNTPNAEVRAADAYRLRPVPVITFAQAAGFEPALEPLVDYLKETSDRAEIFPDVKDTYFALEVSGDSMSPDYPNGSIALVAGGEFPERGDIVVAKLATGQVVMKEYHRKNNVVSLRSRNPAGQNFEWNIKENPGFIQWMFPVMQIIIKPRDQRRAEK